MSSRQRARRDDLAGQRSILVVDDEALNRKLFALTLAKHGYCVLEAANGYLGFVMAHDDRPDLIVMDVRMPGVSGLELTRTLKNDAYTKDIPIIIATAFLIDEAALSESGCDGYISKPFEIPKFLKLVDTIVEQSHAMAAAD